MSFTNRGSRVPQATQLDIDLIKSSNLDKAALKDFLVRLLLRFNDLAAAINVRRDGTHNLEPFANSESIPLIVTGEPATNQYGVQQTWIAGPLLNAAATTIAHGITASAGTMFYALDAFACDTTANVYVPLPYVDVSGTVAAGNIELFIDGTNINIEPTGDATNFDLVVITLRWVNS